MVLVLLVYLFFYYYVKLCNFEAFMHFLHAKNLANSLFTFV